MNRSGERFSYKGEEYIIISDIPFKCSVTRKWIDAFRYVQLSTGLEFVREKEEFLRLFEHIPPPKIDIKRLKRMTKILNKEKE